MDSPLTNRTHDDFDPTTGTDTSVRPRTTLRNDNSRSRSHSRWNARHTLSPIHETARTDASSHRGGRPRGQLPPPPSIPSCSRPSFALTPLRTSVSTPVTPTILHPLGKGAPSTMASNTNNSALSAAYFPTIPPYTRHPSQSHPIPAALDICSDLLSRPIMEWTLEDFSTPTESTGASVLLSLFIDFAHAKRPGGFTSSQRGLLAGAAKLTHPARLLSFIQNEDSAKLFIAVALAKTPAPPPQASLLRPADVPDLVLNDGLRRRISSPGLTRGDLLQILLPFFRFLYPADVGLDVVARQKTHSELTSLVYTVGDAHKLAQSRKGIFCPPTWFILTRADSSSSFLDEPLELRPIEHLGVSAPQFYALPPPLQKSTALSGLFAYLDLKLPSKVIIDVLVHLGNTDPTEIAALLQPAPFHTLCGLPPPRVHSLTLNRLKLILQHDGRGGSTSWHSPPGTIIQQWLMAVLPVLTHTTHIITLTLTPHGEERRELRIDPTLVPTPDSLLPFAHRVRASDGNFRRLELWLVTSCPDLGMDLSHMTTDRQTLTAYTQRLSSANLWVQQAEKYLADSVPCVLLANSQSREIDALIVGELQERIRAADFADADIPFYVSWCSIATSSDSHSTMAKCVFTHPMVAAAMTALFIELPTADTERFPITGHHCMLPLPHPSTHKNDDLIRKAVDQQSTFSQSVTFTMISGLPSTNWFTAPAQRLPSALRMPASCPSPTWAQIFLHGLVDLLPDPTASPIIAVTTDHSCTRCYFTAYADNAQHLIDYTRILHKLMADWAGPDYKLATEIRDARAATRLRQPPSKLTPPNSPDLQAQITNLTNLVQHLATKLDEQSLHLAPPDAASITSTLSSASQSALSHCDTFLSTLSSQLSSFLHDHSLQLASLYARSNSTDSRELQLNNLVRSFAVTSSTADKRTDSFRAAVDKNTEQVARLVEELSLLRQPGNTTLPLPLPDVRPDNTPSPPTTAPADPPTTLPSMPTADDHPQDGEDMTGNTEVIDVGTDVPILTDLCTTCGSGGSELCLCDGCSRLYHPACMTHSDTKNIMCRDCLASTHSTESDNASECSGASIDDSDTGCTSTKPSDEDSTPATSDTPTDGDGCKRLSPRGRAPRTSTLRFTRSTISQKPSPHYSQSTLSFTSKRNTTITDKPDPRP